MNLANKNGHFPNFQFNIVCSKEIEEDKFARFSQNILVAPIENDQSATIVH